ncbi:uracil-DNA glycosylase family protein [Rubritalea tangerina]|uniref:Type-4 uracil-DNA glycosylase n=2 Tax=Rubritalea tangerina TaxID=430798 RepID=A0ABW4Z9Z2_9BACT
MSALAEPLIDYLQQLERQGQTHVHLDDRARLVLRAFFQRARGQEPAAARPVETESKVAVKEAVRLSEVQAPVVEAQKVVAAPVGTSLESLQQQISVDAQLKSLGTLREKLVFSEGGVDADIMLVGEAPSYHDESKGAPFSGPAGKKMEAILKAMGVERHEVYMTNVVKFRPAQANQTTNTRKPNADEINASMRYLMAEVEMVKPKVIIVLGAIAAKALLGPDVPVKDMLGGFHKVAGVPVRATYHPSYLMHQEVTEEKRKVWQDMLAVMELLGMPISEKQRGYFKKK